MFLAAAASPAEPSTFQTVLDTVATRGVDIGLKVVGAIAAWIIGGWIIKFVVRLINKMLDARKVDSTLGRYLATSVGMILRVLLVVAILGIFGIETTSFAALFAAVGVAIGMAWSGLLSNFAAGVFMVLLRPIKVGDFVTVAGITGTVREIGIIVTVIDTPDNVRTIVGNAKVFGDTMSNYSANAYRRVDLVAQLAHGVDYRKAIEILRQRLPNLPHVTKEAAPTVEILEFNAMGPVLCVRPYTHTDTYWDVYFATNALIKDAFTEAGFPVPQSHVHMVTKAA
ncbi:MAG: mechanosensitive ion channel family protein [Deltaproteobacteria bacterium]|nr:mechanosensitive ion channel family protein [Deltaproteobacteria bacterium]